MKNFIQHFTTVVALLALGLGSYLLQKTTDARPNFATIQSAVGQDSSVQLYLYAYDVPAQRSNVPGPAFVTELHTFTVVSYLPYGPSREWVHARATERILLATKAINIRLLCAGTGLNHTFRGKDETDILRWPSPETEPQEPPQK